LEQKFASDKRFISDVSGLQFYSYGSYDAAAAVELRETRLTPPSLSNKGTL